MSFRSLRRLSGLFAGLSLLALVGVSSALAHAMYKSSVPAASTSVASAPTSVRVTFTEELKELTLTVKGPDGSTVSTAAAVIDLANRDTASVPIRPAGNGRYDVAYHTVSADDGEEHDGTFAFGVGAGVALPAILPSTGEVAVVEAWPMLSVGVALLVVGAGFRWRAQRGTS